MKLHDGLCELQEGMKVVTRVGGVQVFVCHIKEFRF